MSNCYNCGNIVDVRAKICPGCGRPEPLQRTFSESISDMFSRDDDVLKDNAFPGTITIRQKSKFVALLLCLFFGWMGGHKFYLGRKGAGTIYLLLFWTSLPMMISFFEFFFLLFMKQRDFEKLYC
ncbi:TM2 domain-containing protein [Enterobacter roggenkampii]